ncbi:nucleotidyltransferase family protein [Roseovarius autotrophicus]|uniref:nucleotidyltransferase family protein n=1 Tax=Roseovarius autotrophicus TaxID=2824121 RepID=UPI001A0F1401|nr:nucleotidyltransferase family protein [Roseovarius autotrophicus]MBE0454883.1 nucleotidyltransferase family protein [Roseovarius sp.]
MTRPETDPQASDFAAVILAGERDARDALRDHAGVASKALIEIDGQPMIARVIAALEGARHVSSVHLSGPAEAVVSGSDVLSGMIREGRVAWSAPGASPSTSAYAMLGRFSEDRKVMITTADHPLLTSEVVDHFCRDAALSGCDVVVGLAPHDLVRGAYPDLKKTVLRFADGQYCGCNLFAFLTADGRRMADFWRQIERERKKPLVVISILGLWAVLRYRMGWLTLERALALLSRKTGLRVGVVVLPYAHASVDVDSVDDYLVLQRYANAASAPQPTPT